MQVLRRGRLRSNGAASTLSCRCASRYRGGVPRRKPPLVKAAAPPAVSPHVGPGAKLQTSRSEGSAEAGLERVLPDFRTRFARFHNAWARCGCLGCCPRGVHNQHAVTNFWNSETDLVRSGDGMGPHGSVRGSI